MQNYNKFNDSDYISDAPDKLNDNFQTIASDYAGTSFPTTDLVEGMTCYRTDKNEVYRHDGNSWQLEYTIVDGGIKAKQADSASSATSAGKATNDANSTETISIVNFCNVYCFLLIPIFVYFTCKGIDNFRK